MVLPAPSGPTRPVTPPDLTHVVKLSIAGCGALDESLGQTLGEDQGLAGHYMAPRTDRGRASRMRCQSVRASGRLTSKATVTGIPWRRPPSGRSMTTRRR